MQLPRVQAFYLQASIILFFLAGSSAATPLYAVYQAAWGFSPITITAIFGAYAVAVLAALLVLGRLSDHVGRRPVLLGAILVQAAAMILYALAHGVAVLLAARIVQGAATGAAAAAVGAGMLDLDRQRGTTANAVGPLLGTATGGVLSGLMVAYLPAPTQLVYLLLCAIYLAQAVGVLAMPETVTPRPGALASLRPRVRLPARVRQPLLLAAPVIIGAWALAGFYLALGPALVRRMIGSSSNLIGGLTVFALAGAGAAAVFALRARAPRTLMLLGTVALLAGVGTTLHAIAGGSLALFFAGTIVAGAGFGAGFQGAIRTVLPLAAEAERAGVLSIVYLIAYLAFGVPAVLAAVRVVHGGVVTAAREYGLAVMALAAVALAGMLARAVAAAGARRPQITASER